MASFFAPKKVTTKEQVRKTKREVTRAQRELDREKRRLAAEAVDVAVAVDRTIGGLAELPDAVDGALS